MTRWQQFWAGLPVIGLLLCLHPDCAVAQGLPASDLAWIRDVRGSSVSTPRYRDRYPGSGRGSDWYALTVEYETSPRWLNAVTFTYYVLFQPDLREAWLPNATSRYVLLRGRREYVNLSEGRHVSEVYLHPSTLERYGTVERLAVVVEVQGEVADAASEPASRAGWWEEFAPVDGLVLSRSQTPFAGTSPDFNESVREGARAAP